MQCKNCNEYGHTIKRCKQPIAEADDGFGNNDGGDGGFGNGGFDHSNDNGGFGNGNSNDNRTGGSWSGWFDGMITGYRDFAGGEAKVLTSPLSAPGELILLGLASLAHMIVCL